MSGIHHHNQVLNKPSSNCSLNIKKKQHHLLFLKSLVQLVGCAVLGCVLLSSAGLTQVSAFSWLVSWVLAGLVL